MNQHLRKEVKMLKALQGISYKEIASYLEIQTNSLYNWLRCEYDLSVQKQQLLYQIICNLKD